MKREIYDECHSIYDHNSGENDITCTVCGEVLPGSMTVYAGYDDSVTCKSCMERMSVRELARLFGAELTTVKDLEDER